MSDEIFSPQFVEFNEQIYFGPDHGYVKVLRLDADSRLDAPFAQPGMTNDGLFSFAGEGFTAFVTQHNIRFIYAKTMGASLTQATEKEPEEATEAPPAPKRRGRPPKAKV